MGKKHLAFASVKDIADLEKVLQENINYLTNTYLSNETLECAIQGLKTFPKENTQQFIGFIRHVDQSLSTASTANGNMYQKLPTILSGSIYYRNHKDITDALSFDELIPLARYAISSSVQDYKKTYQSFDKDLLNAIATKEDDYMYKDSYMYLAHCYLENGQKSSDIAEHIKNTPSKVLHQESIELEQKHLYS